MTPRFDLVIVNGTVVTASDIRYFRNAHDATGVSTDHRKSAAHVVLESKMEKSRLLPVNLTKKKSKGLRLWMPSTQSPTLWDT
jgi:hypothetical protein